MNTYYTILKSSEGIYKDRGSKFVAWAFRCDDENIFKQHLNKIKKQHPKSRHYCYAYKIDEIQKISDDGEPSGTAGKPIMGQIVKNQLDRIGIIVVRYFGGTLLGTGGLIQAYRSAAAAAITRARIVKHTIKQPIVICFDYHLMPRLMAAIKKFDIEIIAQDLQEQAKLTISSHPQESLDIIRKIKAYVNQQYVDEIENNTVIPGISFELLTAR